MTYHPKKENVEKIGFVWKTIMYFLPTIWLNGWMDHGVILTQKEVPWVDSTSYIIAEIEIPESDDWNSIKAPLSFSIGGVQNLVVVFNRIFRRK
jgi:hypothetical protein